MRSIVIALTLAAGTAHAQFKCTGPGGAVTFQQTPCANTAASERLRLPAAEPERPELIRWAIANGRVTIGMTRAEVERSAGRKPDAVNRSVSASGVDEQLVYRRSSQSTTYVYLRDGIVTSHSSDN